MNEIIEELVQAILQIEELQFQDETTKQKIKSTIEIFVKHYGLQTSPRTFN